MEIQDQEAVNHCSHLRWRGAYLRPDQLGLKEQVCQFHLRRWVGRTLHELKQTIPPEWIGVIEETKTLIKELPIQGDRRLLQLWRQIPETHGPELSPLDQLRFLLVRLAQN